MTFSTSAPLKSRREEPRSGGVFIGPAGPRLFAGSAVFATEGTYKLSVHVDHEGGSQTADATFAIEVAGPAKPPAAQKAAPTVAPAVAPTVAPTVVPTVVPTPPTRRAHIHAGANAALRPPPTAVRSLFQQPTEPSAPGLFGPDAAMIERLKIGIRQTAKKRPCPECGALLKRADALLPRAGPRRRAYGVPVSSRRWLDYRALAK